MRKTYTYVLLLINIFLFLVICADGRHWLRQEIDKGCALSVAVDAIDKLEIESGALSSKRLFLRTRHHWEVQQPLVWYANDFAIKQILNHLLALGKEVFFPLEDILASKQTLGDFGLDQPAATLKYRENGHERVVYIGKNTQMRGRVYVYVPHVKRIIIADQSLMECLCTPVETTIDTTIFHVSPFEISSLIVKSDVSVVTVEKSTEKWNLSTPVHAPADAQHVQHVLDALCQLKAQRLEPLQDAFQSEWLAPLYRITLQGNGWHQTLLVGNTIVGQPSQRYAMLEGIPTVLTLDNAVLEGFKNIAERLRSRQLFRFNSAQVHTLELSDGTKGVVLQALENRREWKVFQRRGEAMQGADVDVIEGLLKNLAQVQILNFTHDAPSELDLEKFGLKQPRLTVHLIGQGVENYAYFSDIVEGKCYVKFKDQPFIYEVSPMLLNMLSLDPIFYYDRHLSVVPVGAKITDVRMMMGDRELFAAKLDAEGNFLNLAPPLNDTLKMFIPELKNGCVQDYLQFKYADTIKLNDGHVLTWLYRLELGYEVSNGAKITGAKTTFMFSERVGGTTQFAAVQGAGPVFSLTQKWIDLLHATREATLHP